MPSSTRSASPSSAPMPTEVTSLLPPSTDSRPHTPTPHVPAHHNHHRKPSVGGRSVAGSVRGYGAVPSRPGPVDQAPRVSKRGQRRILTTLPLQFAFFTLVILTFLSLVLTLILFINTAMDLSPISLPYRGSGFAEFWMAAVGSWIGIGGVFFFSHPSWLFFITTIINTVLLLPVLLLSLLSPALKSAHAPLFLVPLSLTLFTLLLSVTSNYLVRRARRKESQRVVRMLTDAAGPGARGEEAVARALVGIEGRGFWRRVGGFLSGIVGFVAGLAGLIVVTLLLIDLSITAYDRSIPLPSEQSQLISVRPSTAPWSFKIHLACSDPPNSTLSSRHQAFMGFESSSQSTGKIPTIIYEPSSGVPGSLALFEYPMSPTSGEAVNPGRWLFDLQEKGKVGRVCIWDRPGYGFSDVMTHSDLGDVADALWQGLNTAGETKGTKFLMIGEGYGGLVTRVFASRHPEHVHSLLHLDAQTAQTYFNENPRGLSVTSLFIHRVATRLFPSLLTPLSLTRLPSVILRRSSSLSRVLASSHPLPSTIRLNENIRKARLQETFGSHSHTSDSFKALLTSGHDYPSTLPAVVVSSMKRINETEGWAEGQRGLAEEVTAEEGLKGWFKVDVKGHLVCEGRGRETCEKAVGILLKN